MSSWWRHQMKTFSALLALCAGNSPATGEFPSQRPVTRSFDVFFDLRLNKRLSKQSWGWWFETPSRLLWRHCNVKNYMHGLCLVMLCCGWGTDRFYPHPSGLHIVAINAIIPKGIFANLWRNKMNISVNIWYNPSIFPLNECDPHIYRAVANHHRASRWPSTVSVPGHRPLTQKWLWNQSCLPTFFYYYFRWLNGITPNDERNITLIRYLEIWNQSPWWRHDMDTVFTLMNFCEGNPQVIDL